jgi:Spy/CpxP family protein refolding chaperone
MLFLTSSIGAFAQFSGTTYTPEQRAQIQNDWMNDNLQLTDEQFGKVSDLNLEYAQKMEEVKTIQGKLNKLKKAREIAVEKDKQLKEVLTKEQFDLFQEKKSELRKMALERAKEPGQNNM